ncbi:MAG: hypothetical protein JOZ29_13455 [Deltaproteobacteria bacterium]|nr:hypothetical protein [Deltaproteobacteria bacterium]
MSSLRAESSGPAVAKAPRLGFAGTGWIGRARLHSLAESRIAQISAIFDPAREQAEDASVLRPMRECCHPLMTYLPWTSMAS